MATPRDVAAAVALIEGATGRRPPESVAKEWPGILVKRDGGILMRAARRFADDEERSGSGWPSIHELLKHYRIVQTEETGRSDQKLSTLAHLKSRGAFVYEQGTGAYYGTERKEVER